jgi:hypothetical protein
MTVIRVTDRCIFPTQKACEKAVQDRVKLHPDEMTEQFWWNESTHVACSSLVLKGSFAVFANKMDTEKSKNATITLKKEGDFYVLRLWSIHGVAINKDDFIAIAYSGSAGARTDWVARSNLDA